MEMSFPLQASKKIKSRMETGKKMPRMKPQIFENKQNLSLVQHTTVCLATKAAATAETAAKTSALLHEARASPRFPPPRCCALPNNQTSLGRGRQQLCYRLDHTTAARNKTGSGLLVCLNSKKNFLA